jgi:hypothetical protein
VGSVGARVARVGLPAVSRSSGEVRAVGSGGPVRQGAVGKLGSTSRSRVTCLEPRFGQRTSGKWGSTARSSGGANGAVVVVLGRVRAGARCSPFIGAQGEEGLGASGPGEARPGQGRGVTGASWLDRWELTAAWRMRIGMGVFGAGEGDLVMGRSGPIKVLSFGAAHRQASSARWPAAAAPRWDRIGERREERGREREKGWDSN